MRAVRFCFLFCAADICDLSDIRVVMDGLDLDLVICLSFKTIFGVLFFFTFGDRKKNILHVQHSGVRLSSAAVFFWHKWTEPMCT